MMGLTRRKLISGLGLLIAAPSIIRVADLMPIKTFADKPTFANRVIQLSYGPGGFSVEATPTEHLWAGDFVTLEYKNGIYFASKASFSSGGDIFTRQIGVAI